MIHSNVGHYLKQLVVNQGFTIKQFSKIYGTTEGYMGDIFEKEDVSTSVIRKMQEKLDTTFSLTSELDYTLSPDYIREEKTAYDSIKSGRPIAFKIKDIDRKDLNNCQKEIMALKEQLRLKDEIIAGKDELILLLKTSKN